MSFGDETSGAFESHLFWRRLEDRRKNRFWAAFVLVENKTSGHLANHRRNCECSPAKGAVFIN